MEAHIDVINPMKKAGANACMHGWRKTKFDLTLSQRQHRSLKWGSCFTSKKPIFLRHPVSSSLSYKVEIYGMLPIVLNGTLSDIRPRFD
ncbi:hypothetical protein D6792_03540 [Candidatus Parcubacteria bacterium]|nr:MAG: hypothetical protein D6792_03540 [Candidatus Parcubacteria bacterium]